MTDYERYLAGLSPEERAEKQAFHRYLDAKAAKDRAMAEHEMLTEQAHTAWMKAVDRMTAHQPEAES